MRKIILSVSILILCQNLLASEDPLADKHCLTDDIRKYVCSIVQKGYIKNDNTSCKEEDLFLEEIDYATAKAIKSCIQNAPFPETCRILKITTEEKQDPSKSKSRCFHDVIVISD